METLKKRSPLKNFFGLKYIILLGLLNFSFFSLIFPDQKKYIQRHHFMLKKKNFILARANSLIWALKALKSPISHGFLEFRQNRQFRNWKSPIFGDWRSIAKAKFLSPWWGVKSRIWRFFARNGNTGLDHKLKGLTVLHLYDLFHCFQLSNFGIWMQVACGPDQKVNKSKQQLMFHFFYLPAVFWLLIRVYSCCCFESNPSIEFKSIWKKFKTNKIIIKIFQV